MTDPWELIESAPRDGTPILGWDPEHDQEGYFDSVYVVRWVQDGYFVGPEGGWIEAGGEGYAEYHPTHWKPVPKGPGK